MNKTEIRNLMESKHYNKVKKAASLVGIEPEKALEFIDTYVQIPISDCLAIRKAAIKAGISLTDASNFNHAYYLLED